MREDGVFDALACKVAVHGVDHVVFDVDVGEAGDLGKFLDEHFADFGRDEWEKILGGKFGGLISNTWK